MNYLKNLKSIYKILIVIVIILALTNPSTDTYYSFDGMLKGHPSKTVKRSFNGFIFSIYTIVDFNYETQELSESKYFGCLLNFILLDTYKIN